MNIKSIFLFAFRADNLEEEKYMNYVVTLKNGSNFQYHLVVTIKDLNTGKIKEICTEGNFLSGALHQEYKLGYDEQSEKRVEQIAVKNKKRYFELKNKEAIYNVGFNNYTPQELSALVQNVDFSILAREIKRKGRWEKKFSNEKLMLMYAHMLFNYGILTGENNCFGGTLIFVERMH